MSGLEELDDEIRRYSLPEDELDAKRDEEGMQEAEADYEAMERKGKRHPGDFYGWPSDEQMSYFVRGGR